ncbi:hypothetical protein STEG23_032737, partial [Scotinomys teguina]
VAQVSALLLVLPVAPLLWEIDNREIFSLEPFPDRYFILSCKSDVVSALFFAKTWLSDLSKPDGPADQAKSFNFNGKERQSYGTWKGWLPYRIAKHTSAYDIAP